MTQVVSYESDPKTRWVNYVRKKGGQFGADSPT